MPSDSYRKVTVTDLTLTNMDTEEVKADDPTVLFTDEVDVCGPRSDGQSLGRPEQRTATL